MRYVVAKGWWGMALYTTALGILATLMITGGLLAWAVGQAKRKFIWDYANVQVRHSEMKLEDWHSHGAGLFQCAGCDAHFRSDRPGVIRIGEGFVFCSAECQAEPLPMPSIGGFAKQRLFE